MLCRLISLSDVLFRLSISKAHLYRMIRDGRFPAQVRVSERRIGFVESEVESWLSERVRRRKHAELACSENRKQSLGGSNDGTR